MNDQVPSDACAHVKREEGYPVGCHTYLSEAEISHVHTCHRGCSAYVLAQQSRIRRDLCMASADSNIFLYKKKKKIGATDETKTQNTKRGSSA